MWVIFQITMTWSSDNVSVHDYEVGLASTSNNSAPDIMGFRSTKQHRKIHIMHTDLPEGTPFFIVIKSISKANVEGLQVRQMTIIFSWSRSHISKIISLIFINTNARILVKLQENQPFGSFKELSQNSCTLIKET